MRRSEAGFSLIEITLVAGLLAFALTAMLGLLFGSQAAFVDRQDETDARQVARIGLHALANELRLAGFRGGNLDALASAGEFELAFVADLDDGSAGLPCSGESPSAPRPERVSYDAREDGTLWRRLECQKGKGNAWQVEADWTPVASGVDVNAPLFRFFDKDGREIVPGGKQLGKAARDAVVSVGVRLGVQVADRSRVLDPNRHASFRGSTRILLRNRLTNQ